MKAFCIWSFGQNILSSASLTKEILANVVTKRCHSLDHLHWNLFMSFDTENMHVVQLHNARASFLDSLPHSEHGL